MVVTPFHTDTHSHTDTDTDRDNPVYHDRDDCPYGQAITQHANAIPGRDGRRRCDWCAGHVERRLPKHAGVRNS
jgi:H+-transporting ATPase